ncbi:hypothetical protein D3877_28390 [Azospirillum cavernae]|uniref:AFP-like domain-containing protein n=1 Tax=Azospirillum cavernae TaxID=2320860 RepID=A0A418VKX6_9PROT|nr:N-acetylneuraminate synthase family protein [Azospirillum cavernae]RJF76806.1 hypothetical protein D3877_28390 [Azospirillum cavernae]
MLIETWDSQNDVLLIAEVGNNHEGSFALAQDLVGLAAEAGAGAVKFQTFRTEHYVSPSESERFARLKRFELSGEQFAKLAQQARDAGLIFLSTPFDLGSVAVLEPLVSAYKIASGDNTFYPLIEAVARRGKPMLVSTGIADMQQIRYADALVRRVWAEAEQGDPGLAILHCVSAYPTPPEEANLATISTLAAAFPDATVGYSDHTIGIDAAVLAVGLGARIIEKHFTIDNNYSSFRDHQLSANPEALREMADRIRTASVMLGSSVKERRSCEDAGAIANRRSIVADHDLSAGAVLTMSDLTWVRPGTGLPPGAETLVLGRRLTRNLPAGSPILKADLDEGAQDAPR